MRALLPLARALRAATLLPIESEIIDRCLDEDRDQSDALFLRARSVGLAGLLPAERSGHLWRVIGEVAESVAEQMLADLGYNVFWHVTHPGVHGVDLLLLSPDGAVLALEVKGTLRAGAIPRLTPSRFRQMSREWLDQPDNPAMAEWELKAEDIYAGVTVVDFALSGFRVALSADFELYAPVVGPGELEAIRTIDGPDQGCAGT